MPHITSYFPLSHFTSTSVTWFTVVLKLKPCNEQIINVFGTCSLIIFIHLFLRLREMVQLTMCISYDVPPSFCLLLYVIQVIQVLKFIDFSLPFSIHHVLDLSSNLRREFWKIFGLTHILIRQNVKFKYGTRSCNKWSTNRHRRCNVEQKTRV